MAAPVTVPIHRLSLDDIVAMQDAGVLTETDRVELEGGVLVDMVPVGGQHAHRVEWLTRHLVRAVPDDLAVRVQDTFLIGDGGFYEPDLMVIRRTGDELPQTALLVVEVAVSSRRRDEEKAAAYAAARVEQYWIVDPGAREVVVYAEPSATGYVSVRGATPGEQLALSFASAAIDVSQMLGD